MHHKSMYDPRIHHRRSIRLKGYDYSQAGLYFITICCQDRAHRFGHIENGEMVLNEFGQIAHNEWMKTPALRSNVELGEWVVMSNHFHGIIRLLGQDEMGVDMDVGVGVDEGEGNSPLQQQPATATMGKGELHSPLSPASPPPSEMVGGVFKTPLRSPSQTVGAIVRGYKSAVTKQLGLLGFNGKVWQRNYYEHIIRNEQAYQRISAYILNNPAQWADDMFYATH